MRQELTPSMFAEASSRLVEDAIVLIKKYKPECIHCFLPIDTKDEINTTPIIQYCWESNINVVAQLSRLDTTSEHNAFMTAMGWGSDV